MGIIRALRPEDASQALELNDKLLGKPAVVTQPARRRERFLDLYFGSPLRDDGIQPLVYQEPDGRITGFIGALVQPARFRGQLLRCAVTAHFCVDSERRGLIGVKLLAKFLDGPQDISIADESNAASRRLWEAVGGDSLPLCSLEWTAPFRPVQFALNFAKERASRVAKFATILRPFVSLFDRAIHASLNDPEPEVRLISEPLDPVALYHCQVKFQDDRFLLPCHTEESLKWRLDRLAAMKRFGDLRAFLLRSENREIAGCYLYFLQPGGNARLVKLLARPSNAPAVWQHLFRQAYGGGATALTGQFGGDMNPSFAGRTCLVRHSSWTLAHSKDPELRSVVRRGESCFSRLEGEWCQHLE